MGQPDDPCSAGNTRLDRLLQLIQGTPTGHGSVGLGVRKMAGKQLAQLLEPSLEESCEGALSVIQRLLPALTGKSWEGRMAASFAMERIVEAWCSRHPVHAGSDEDQSSQIDLTKLIEGCPELVASGGAEYDLDLSKIGQKDFLRQQRRTVSESLGIREGMGMDELAGELVTDADLLTITTTTQAPKAVEMSARERAMLKRQGRLKAQKSNGNPDPSAKPEDAFAQIPRASWPVENPFGALLNTLQSLMFHSSWQARHGSILGLQAFNKFLAGSKRMALRLLCLLALDRFGDFNGDQMVAPVREAAAQLLCLLQISQTDDWLLGGIGWLCGHQHSWQIRQSGMMALKYNLVNHNEGIVELAKAALDDADDDVRATAALILARLKVTGLEDKIIGLLGDVMDESSPVVGPLFALLSATMGSVDDHVIQLLCSFAGFPSKQVRLKVAQILLHTQSSRLAADIFQLAFQRCLIEGEAEVAEAYFILGKGIGKPDMVNDKMVALLRTPLDSPFDPRHCTFYRLGGGGKTGEPGPHDLGFKPADMMLLSQDTLLLGRRLAALLIAPYYNNLSTGIALVDIWLGNKPSADPTGLEGRARILSLCHHHHQHHRISLDHKREIIDWLMVREGLEPIQQDIVDALIVKLDLPEDLALFNPASIDDESGLRCMRYLLCSLSNKPFALIQSIESLSLEDRLGYAWVCSTIPSSCFDGFVDIWELVKSSLAIHPRLAAKTIASLMPKLGQSPLLEAILVHLLSSTSASESDRLGSVMAIDMLVTANASETTLFLLPYLPVLLMALLAWMSDSQAEVRPLAASSFASVIKLVTLSSLDGSICCLKDEQLKQMDQDARLFMSQLIGGDNSIGIEPYVLPEGLLSPDVQLRSYQQDGLAWLMFLRRWGLHGCLADDMGLGKTLQTLCCLAADRHALNHREGRKPSLVICPGSLVGHWAHEASLYCPGSLPSVIQWAGPARQSSKASTAFNSADLVICSYETARNDAHLLQPVSWSYVVLDEGHLIRNARTKTAQAIKALRADHRLILSGTPIQNNVLELWGLFDFLMPGFLGGTEADFMARYGRTILAVQPNTAATANNNVGGGEDFEEAERKLTQLHKQVLPFILRRMKQDVLADLPPKIIQDYECEPSALQQLLLADLQKHYQAKEEQDKKHIFQILQYLRKVCVHPGLAFGPEHPLWPQPAFNLEDCSQAPKLVLLQELLQECGIISAAADQFEHRVLIFAQHKATLDLVERLVLVPHSIPWLRIDGSQSDPSARFKTATRFNQDPSIPVLLLTTRVGGLGLNLTGADTVIFLEHDWNPQADLQAMDRAHRLGQTRTVNVYRLVVRGTLEERILGLQAWKKRIAGTVVTQQNAQPTDAPTSDILDLFLPAPPDHASVGPPSKRSKVADDKPAPGTSWIDKVVAASGLDVEEAAEEYAQEFDLPSFLDRLKAD